MCHKAKPNQTKCKGIEIQKEQLKYIQGQINKIKFSVEDRQYQLAWLTIKDVSERKSSSRAKLRFASKEERLQKWKEHYKNLLGKPS